MKTRICFGCCQAFWWGVFPNPDGTLKIIIESTLCRVCLSRDARGVT